MNRYHSKTLEVSFKEHGITKEGSRLPLNNTDEIAESCLFAVIQKLFDVRASDTEESYSLKCN